MILDRTSFYAESGGQEYDTGNIVVDGAADFEVTNVQIFNGYVLHIGHLKYGKLSVGEKVVASYDEVRTELDREQNIFSYIPSFCHCQSFDVGHCGITTLLLTSSTTVFARCSATTLIKKVHSLHRRNYDSTFLIKLKSRPATSQKSSP